MAPEPKPLAAPARNAGLAPEPTAQEPPRGPTLHVLSSEPPESSAERAPGEFLTRLVEAAVASGDDPAELDAKALDGAVAFTGGQLSALPAPLRAAFAVGMAGFRAWVLLRHLKPFVSLPLGKRRRAVERWSFGRIGLLRQLFRPLRAVALLSYFELAGERRARG